MDKYTILANIFGYDKFRKGQEFFVDNILAGNDVLGIMPTGAGKSVCFQIPALMMQGITLVISPLISLMKDQVSALVQSGVRAAYLNSSLTENQYYKALANAKNGMYKIIYVAPERLNTYGFSEFAKTADISMITVDEAHCVSQWGQDFRPSYLEIPRFIQQLPRRPVVSAFTATATKRVREDIIKILNLQNPQMKITGFDRPNLSFEVAVPDDKDGYLKNFLKLHMSENGIIYCNTRKNVDYVYNMLKNLGYNVGKYHAGMPQPERNANQDDFLFDRIKIMVATNAFGMGIDKSDISYVVHYNMPGSLENYYQEAGRAGRDGSEAVCLLLYSKKDYHIQEFLIEKTEKNPDISDEEFKRIKENEKEKLKKMIFYCRSKECLRKNILNYFGEDAADRCDKCSICNTPPEDLFEISETDNNDVYLSDILEGFYETSDYYAPKQVAKAVKNYDKVKSRAKKMLEETNDTPLFTELKFLRSAIAKREGVPAFVVFSDMTLRDMCDKQPKTSAEFLNVSGVGVAKLEKYGEEFISVIQRFS